MGHFAEKLPDFRSKNLKWDTLFYLLDGGLGVSLTGSKWFQRLLGISEKPEIKALAVASRAYAILSQYAPDKYPILIAKKACDYVWKLKSEDSTNPSWGSGFKWRTSTGHVIDDSEPSSLVTALVGLAFLETYVQSNDAKYFRRAQEVSEYFINENGFKAYPDDSICFYYTPKMHVPITNASAFVALFLRKINKISGNYRSKELAEKSYRFIIGGQELDGSWRYFPSRTMKENVIDNYHTGFILESILEGLSLEYSRDLELSAERGLKFYSKMFRSNGQPIFNTRREYPIDIHDAAQGIIVFSLSHQILSKGLAIAKKIRTFANAYMRSSNGRYISRVYRFGKSNLITPRWADSWMFLGLAELLRADNLNH